MDSIPNKLCLFVKFIASKLSVRVLMYIAFPIMSTTVLQGCGSRDEVQSIQYACKNRHDSVCYEERDCQPFGIGKLCPVYCSNGQRSIPPNCQTGGQGVPTNCPRRC